MVYIGSAYFEIKRKHISQYRNGTLLPSSKNGLKSQDTSFIIRELTLRGDICGALTLLSKMRSQGINITHQCYNNILMGCRTADTVETARYIYLALISDGYSPDLETYKLIINAHIAAGDISSAFSLYRKMERSGLEADLTIFTVLIDGLVSRGHTENAWRLYNYMRTWRLIEPDETLFTVMIRATVPSKDAEKAMVIYSEMLERNIRPTGGTYEALISSLSQRKDYAHKCFQFYDHMKSAESRISYNTLLQCFRACETTGNVRKVNELLKETCDLGFTINDEIATAAVRAMTVDPQKSTFLSFKKIDRIRKAWHIINTVLAVNKVVTANMMNAIITIYENSGYYDYALNLLHYFPRFGIAPNYATHCILLRIFGDKLADPGKFFTVWHVMCAHVEPNSKLLCMALNMAMKSNSSKRTLYVLEQMYRAKTFPSSEHIRMLYTKGKNVPQIHIIINKLLSLRKSLTHETKNKDSQMLETFIEEHRLRHTAH